MNKKSFFSYFYRSKNDNFQDDGLGYDDNDIENNNDNNNNNNDNANNATNNMSNKSNHDKSNDNELNNSNNSYNNNKIEYDEDKNIYGTLVMEVIDSGVGMLPDQTSRLFKEIVQFNPGELQVQCVCVSLCVCATIIFIIYYAFYPIYFLEI